MSELNCILLYKEITRAHVVLLCPTINVKKFSYNEYQDVERYENELSAILESTKTELTHYFLGNPDRNKAKLLFFEWEKYMFCKLKLLFNSNQGFCQHVYLSIDGLKPNVNEEALQCIYKEIEKFAFVQIEIVDKLHIFINYQRNQLFSKDTDFVDSKFYDEIIAKGNIFMMDQTGVLMKEDHLIPKIEWKCTKTDLGEIGIALYELDCVRINGERPSKKEFFGILFKFFGIEPDEKINSLLSHAIYREEPVSFLKRLIKRMEEYILERAGKNI